ncbi:MAG TPA: fluoride efflux transporter CrcB [Candidatus Baltobacteraceae bacterium]|nr:fluoride efflux transporter CrcB [Candidatus Baltobacteraceae bacterium]
MDSKAIVAVALGGALGAVLRYLVGSAFLQRFGPGFPWGTFFINVTGSFFIGVIAQLAFTRSFGVTPMVRIFAATGVLGGYTTFSTFSLDSVVLVGDGAAPVALAYAAGSVISGFFAAYVGQVVARLASG